MILDGAFLHGKWEFGEWSLSPFLLQTHGSLGETAPDTLAIVGDPFDDILASFHNDEKNIAVTVYRREGVVNRYSVVVPDGNIEFSVDERGRPTNVVGPDTSVSLTWSDDATSVDLVVDENGTITSETVAIDLSDVAVIAAVNEFEAATGIDSAAMRDWIGANPGRLGAIARGAQALPQPASVFAKVSQNANHRSAKNATALQVGERVVRDVVLIGAIVWTATVVASQVLTVQSAIAALAIGGLVAIAIVAAAYILYLFLVDFLDACYPCTLSCFWNCTAGSAWPVTMLDQR